MKGGLDKQILQNLEKEQALELYYKILNLKFHLVLVGENDLKEDHYLMILAALVKGLNLISVTINNKIRKEK